MEATAAYAVPTIVPIVNEKVHIVATPTHIAAVTSYGHTFEPATTAH